MHSILFIQELKNANKESETTCMLKNMYEKIKEQNSNMFMCVCKTEGEVPCSGCSEYY